MSILFNRRIVLVQSKDLPSPSILPLTVTISRHVGKSKSKYQTVTSLLNFQLSYFQTISTWAKFKIGVDCQSSHSQRIFTSLVQLAFDLLLNFLWTPPWGRVLLGLPLAGWRAFSFWLLWMWLLLPLLECSDFIRTREDNGEFTNFPQTGLEGATQSMVDLWDATTLNMLRNYPNVAKLTVCLFWFFF